MLVLTFVNKVVLDGKTAGFYLTLIALLMFDFILIVWAFYWHSNWGASAYASELPAAVSDISKPSPFDIADSKRGPVQSVRRRVVKVNNRVPGDSR